MLNPERLPPDPTERLERRIRAWGLILWPSFLAACLLEVMVFSIVDPAELRWPGHAGAPSTRAIYTVAFFAFWLVAALCSCMALWLDRSHRPRTPTELSGRSEAGPGV